MNQDFWTAMRECGEESMLEQILRKHGWLGIVGRATPAAGGELLE
jgi:hypothetical protein